ncbi:MAG TPA: DUF6510 family protein [Actinomycetes bacterium]|nr:DUF6510 family protein [Actinomycetes bacterium]
MSETWIDGNMLAGGLREIFAIDLTVARTQCAGCGQTVAVAETRVYQHAPGLVARCRSCDAVLLRLVRTPQRAYLDLQGMRWLELQLPDEAG